MADILDSALMVICMAPVAVLIPFFIADIAFGVCSNGRIDISGKVFAYIDDFITRARNG